MSNTSEEEQKPAFRIPDVGNIDMNRIMKRHQKDEPDFIPHNSGGRDIEKHMFVLTGGLWVGGFLAGGAYGFQEGWRTAASTSFKVRMNSVLNQVSKQGNKVGNALATIGFIHTGFTWICTKLEVDNYVQSQWTVPALAGALTGGLYKSTASPRACLLAAGIGGGASCAYSMGSGYIYEAIFGKGQRRSR
jgi:hypothetical protein